MIKYNFQLRKDKVTQDGLMPIRLLFRIDSAIIKRNTGLNCKLEDWQNNRVKANSKKDEYYGYDEINEKLQKIESKIQEISLFFRANKIELTKESFIEKYDFKGKIVITPELDFFKCFDEYIDKGKSIKTYNTIKGQTTVRNYLEKFADEKGFTTSFNIIDEDFFDLLRDYSYQTKEIKQNYFCKIIKVIKSFLNWATEKGYNTKRDFEKFKAADHDIDIIYLTYEELMKLYNKDLKSDKLSHVRDFYCMGCFTGLRFSDLSKLHLANISDDHIVISIQKTKTQNHAIKLNKYAKEILNKYKGTIYEPLPVISSQKFNEYIKDCCELAEINQSFTIHWFVGNQKKSLTQPKHRFITSHTARKTFITNSLLLGMEPKAIKKIANIKKDAVLDKYMKVTEAFTDEQMDKAWG